jgi:FkbM family methyltransferase
MKKRPLVLRLFKLIDKFKEIYFFGLLPNFFLWIFFMRYPKIYIPLLNKSVYYRKNTSDFPNIVQHFKRGELFNVPWREYNSYIDVGSYAGYSILVAKHFNPNLKIFGLEPHPRNYEILNLNFPGSEAVTKFNTALWINDEGISLFDSPDGLWASGVVDSGHDLLSYKVSTITFSKLLSEIKLNRVDLLKLDVEGSEADILEHSGHEIFEHCSNLLIELHYWLPLVEKRVSDSILRLSLEFNFRHDNLGEFIYLRDIAKKKL